MFEQLVAISFQPSIDEDIPSDFHRIQLRGCYCERIFQEIAIRNRNMYVQIGVVLSLLGFVSASAASEHVPSHPLIHH